MMKQEIEVARPFTEMKIRPYEHRAKYYETDQMGIIHHSNYLRWFESARIQFLKEIGIDFRWESFIIPIM